MRFSATSPHSASDLPDRMELQINPPRLQMLTSSSADLASLRYLCVIATEASNLLPLFYRSLPIPILTPYPRFVLPIRGCHHAGMFCCISFRFFKLYRASLRIGLRCLHSPRCRNPARISGKDFPLPFNAASNQPSLICFFFSIASSLPLRFTCPFIACPSSPRSLNFFYLFKLYIFRFLGLRHLRTLPSWPFIGNFRMPVRHQLLTLLSRLRCVSISSRLSDSVTMREWCFLLCIC
jgi:hypothetical protein